MPRGDQLARQWRLLQFLGRAQGLPVGDTARRLGCAVRTVWRDLKSFENMAERQRREDRPAHDFAWMWEELGLPRPQ